jgi:hypothetical protein
MNRDRVSRSRRVLWWLSALTVAWWAVACGGGVGTGGTGAFASGPITGFGSIVVDAVHFDESAARVEDDDGSGRDRNELRLGTMVEIDSSEIRDGAAVASRVRIVSALIGSVESVASGALVVNGLTVHIDAGTVFDDRFVGGPAAVETGRTVEVFGFVLSGSGDIQATRIEPDDGAGAFKFRGVVSALNTQARTFDIGSQRFSFPGSVSGASELRDGAFVRVLVGTQRNVQGRWNVAAIGNTGPGGGDGDQAKARGVITTFTSTANFSVGGFTIDASAAQIHGGPLAAGQRVEVDGRLQAGVLIASSVDVEDQNDHDVLELRGAIASVDTVAKVFVIAGRSERVSYARPDIVFENGSAALLQVGRNVRATGQLSADGTLVEATRIHFD